jgi:hypothetical protein
MDEDSNAQFNYGVELTKLEARIHATYREQLALWVTEADVDAATTAMFAIAQDYAGTYAWLGERRRLQARRGLSS